MRTYTEAVERLNGRESRKLAHNTYLHRVDADTVAVKYHDTDVVVFSSDGTVVLHDGGWLTLTTKERMCSYGPYRVFAEKGTWYVEVTRGTSYPRSGDSGTVPYFDGIAIRDGVVVNADELPVDAIAADKATKRAVSAYLRGLTPAVLHEVVEHARTVGMGGDCWYCAMRTEGGDSLGDASGNVGHLHDHLEEKYYMASLMLNALREAGYGQAETVLVMEYSNAIKRALRRYFYAHLLQGPTSGRRQSAARAQNF